MKNRYDVNYAKQGISHLRTANISRFFICHKNKRERKIEKKKST